MNILWLDTETFSTVDIKEGSARYFEGGGYPIIIAFAGDDGPVQTVSVSAGGVWDTKDVARVERLVAAAGLIVMHNRVFDARAMSAIGVRIPLEKSFCTMAQAAMHGLPRALADLSAIFHLGDSGKDAAGKALIRKFCMLQKDGSRARYSGPDWDNFLSYAGQDVVAMRALYSKLPRGNLPVEMRIWRADQAINDRGVLVDLALANNMTAWLADHEVAQRARTKGRTQGALESVTQGAVMLRYLLAEHGVALPDLREQTLARRLKDEELPAAVRELVLDRMSSAKATGAKYQAATKTVSRDGRVRDSLQYCGAGRTGRWAGRGLQMQNFARPTWKAQDIEEVCQQVASGVRPAYSAPEAAKECIRGLIIAPAGKTLGVVDYSQIEARVLPWLAGDDVACAGFAKQDAEGGPDVYQRTYGAMFGVDPSKVNKTQRQQGKIATLALGYGGGVGALLTGCSAYGTNPAQVAAQTYELADLELRGKAAYSRQFAKGAAAQLEDKVYVGLWCMSRLWRQANAKVVQLWHGLEQACVAVTRGGPPARVGRLVVEKPHPNWVRIRMPSGRHLMFAQPKLDEQGRFTYTGVNPYTRKWGRCDTYGGKLAEQVTQGTARDIMAAAMADITEAGGEIVLTVHDELVQELSGDWTLQRMEDMMTATRPWTAGLPLAADGFQTTRYRK